VGVAHIQHSKYNIDVLKSQYFFEKFFDFFLKSLNLEPIFLKNVGIWLVFKKTDSSRFEA
jgi:hypothetical protein